VIANNKGEADKLQNNPKIFLNTFVRLYRRTYQI